MRFTIFYKKNRLSRIEKKVKKGKKLDFLKRGYSMVFVKNWQFLQLFILGKLGPIFHDILERKNPFVQCKNIKFNRSKKWDFSIFF